MSDLWQCPKCGRKFKNKKQAHSCSVYPLKKHFEGKPVAKELFDVLIKKMKKNLSSFKVQPLPCCIHLDRISSFAAVFARKDKIKLSILLDKKIDDPRVSQTVKISNHQYKNIIDITNKSEIDLKLMTWLKNAYEYKK